MKQQFGCAQGNTCAINYDVTSSRPSAAATDAASRGVAHTHTSSVSADCPLDTPHSDGDDTNIKLLLMVS